MICIIVRFIVCADVSFVYIIIICVIVHAINVVVSVIDIVVKTVQRPRTASLKLSKTLSINTRLCS